MAEIQALTQELIAHLQECARDSSIPLQEELLRRADLALPAASSRDFKTEQRHDVVAAIVSLLPTLQQDPTLVLNLLARLLPGCIFHSIQGSVISPELVVQGLTSDENMVAYNNVAIAYLEKAAEKPEDAATIAVHDEIVQALVRLFLCVQDAGIADRASRVLIELLAIDQASSTMNGSSRGGSVGQGMVWRRIFGDRSVYSLFFEACSTNGPSTLNLSKARITIAQARLMEWLPHIARLNLDAVIKSQHPEVESQYHIKGGLLDLAALHAGDLKDDILMYQCVINFYIALLEVKSINETALLQYLIDHDLHEKTASIYLAEPGPDSDPLESLLLSGPSAKYIATYASRFPKHFLTSEMPEKVLARLHSVFDMSPSRWANSESPKDSLHLLVSLPKSLLLSKCSNADWVSNPLSLLPTRATHPDVLYALAALLQGPQRSEEYTLTMNGSSPALQLDNPPPPSQLEDASQARALYYHIIAHNTNFHSDLARHASTLALKDLALAALSVMKSIATANWSDSPSQPLPTTIATPVHGYEALLAPPALEHSFAYLLSSPTRFRGTSARIADDAGSVYQIATAKFEILEAMLERLEGAVRRHPGAGFEEIAATVSRIVAMGPLGGAGERGDPQAVVATMEA